MQVKELENKLDLNTHIGAWYIEPKICDEILQFMHLNKHLFSEGLVGANTVKKSSKESLDIAINPKSYFFPWKNYMDSLHQCVKKYTEKFSYCENLSRFGVCEPYNIQHYNPGGGFKKYYTMSITFIYDELGTCRERYSNNTTWGDTEISYSIALFADTREALELKASVLTTEEA